MLAIDAAFSEDCSDNLSPRRTQSTCCTRLRTSARRLCSGSGVACCIFLRSWCQVFVGVATGRQPHKQHEVQEFNNRVRLLRKSLRAGIVISSAVLLAWVWVWLIQHTESGVYVALDLRKPLTIQLSHCLLRINVATGRAREPLIHYKLYHSIKSKANANAVSGDWASNASANHFTLDNTVGGVESCQLTLELPQDSVLNALTIECSGRCIVTTDGYDSEVGESMPWTVSNMLKVTSATTEKTTVVLTSLIVGYLDIDVMVGDLFLDNVLVQRDSSIILHDGDAHMELRGDAQIAWKESSDYYCLAAPRIQNNASGAHTCNLHTRESGNGSSNGTVVQARVFNCTGFATLCGDTCITQLNNETNETLVLPSITLRIFDGSFYATRPLAGSPLVMLWSDSFIALGGLTLHPTTSGKVATAAKWLANSATSNQLFTVYGPRDARLARQSAGFFFVAQQSSSVATLSPWLVSTITLGLLADVLNVNEIEVRFRRGPCPYRSELGLKDLSHVGLTIKSKLMASDSHSFSYVLRDPEVPGSAPTFWFVEDIDEIYWPMLAYSEAWWLLNTTEASSPEIQTLEKSPLLLIAFLFSLLIGLLTASSACYVAFVVVSSYTAYFAVSGSHINHYRQVQQLMNANAESPLQDSPAKLPAGTETLFLRFAWLQPSQVDADVAEEELLTKLRKLGVFKDGAESDDASKTRVKIYGRAVEIQGKAVVIEAAKKAFQRNSISVMGAVGMIEAVGASTNIYRLDDLSVTAINIVFGRAKLPRPSELPSLLVSLPPVFGLVDLWVQDLKRYYNDSLFDFFSIPGFAQPVASVPCSQPYLLSDFKNTYSRFCFLRRMTENNLRNETSLEMFRSFSLRLEAVPVAEQLDAFTRIRWRSAREWEQDQGLRMPRIRPGETSVDCFIRTMCVRTNFDVDTIVVDHFKAKYTWFCEKHRILDVVTVSKALLLQRARIDSCKVGAFRIKPKADEEGNVAPDAFVLDKRVADQHVQQMMATGSAAMNLAESRFWLFDSVGAFAHVLTVILISMPQAIFIVIWSVTYSPFSTWEEDRLFSINDVMNNPSRCKNVVYGYPCFMPVVALYLFFMVAQYVQLVMFYLIQKYPIDPLQYFADERDKAHAVAGLGVFWTGLRTFDWQVVRVYLAYLMETVLNVLQWLSFFLSFTVIVFLLAMLLVWLLLSAILNPEAFLAYTALAGTFVTFVIAKYSQMKATFSKSHDEVVASFGTMMGDKVNATLKTIVNDALDITSDTEIDMGMPVVVNSEGSGIGDIAGGQNQQLFQQHVALISGSSLGKVISSSGLDVSLVLRLACGDASALSLFAEEQGLPIELVTIMVSLAECDRATVVKTIGILVQKYSNSSLVSVELAAALADLAYSPSPAKAEKCTKAIYRHGLPALLKFWAKNGPGSGARVKPEEAHDNHEKLDAIAKVIKELKAAHPDLDTKVVGTAFLSVRHAGQRPAMSESDKQLLDTLEAMAHTPQLRQAAAARIMEPSDDPKMQRLVADQSSVFLDSQLGGSTVAREAATKLLASALPPLLGGLISLLIEQDFQAFVSSLRHVHGSLVEQRANVVECCGEKLYTSLENIGSIFNLLELVLRTGRMQDAILLLLQEKSILKLPPEVARFLQFLIWLREQKGASADPANADLLTSYSKRVDILKSAINSLGLEEEILVLLEILMAVALKDLRALTVQKMGSRIANCILMFAKEADVPVVKDKFVRPLLTEMFQISMSMLVALKIGRQGMDLSLLSMLQRRTGIDINQMSEIVQLFTHGQTSPLAPPVGMAKWGILGAAAKHVGLDINEAVGLVHCCMGHTGTPEVMALIRDLLRRQGVHPQNVDGFVKNLLAVSFAKTDQAVMQALQELRIKHRYLALIGLGRCTPRYFSEKMLASCNIIHPEVLRARLDVPFRYEDDPCMWEEWFEKASRDIQNEDIGAWQHFSVELRQRPAVQFNNNALTLQASNSGSTANCCLSDPMASDSFASPPGHERPRGVAGLRAAMAKRTQSAVLIGAPSVPLPGALDGPAIGSSSIHAMRGSGCAAGQMEAQADEEHVSPLELHLRRLHQLQLALNHPGSATGGIGEEEIAHIIRHYNMSQKSAANKMSSAMKKNNKKAATRVCLALSGQPGDILRSASHFFGAAYGAAYEDEVRERQLRQLQDFSTGAVLPIDVDHTAIAAVLRILSIRSVVSGGASKSSESKRAAVFQEFAQMLGVEQRNLTVLFNLVASERTQEAMIAVSTLGKAFMPEKMVQAAAEVTYWMRRLLPVYQDIRTSLWDLATIFGLPRFFTPAILLPALSYPPQLREVGSVVHYIMEPVLERPELNSTMQMVLFDLMGLVSGALEGADSIVEVFGLASSEDAQSSKLSNLVRMMIRTSVSEKIAFVPNLLRIFTTSVTADGRFNGLDKQIVDVIPFVLFFAGFPYAELPDTEVPHGSTSVVDYICEKTGIRVEVLRGIDISQWSISPLSGSDETKLTHESVIALLLPLFANARVLDSSLPSDGLVKAIVSLSLCTTEHLEPLAETLRLHPFFVQLLVHLVDLSKNVRDQAQVTRVFQQIRMSGGVCNQLKVHLGLDPEKFLALLELTLPDKNDLPIMPMLLEKTGLAALGIELHVANLLYALVSCALLHLRGEADPLQHEQYTHLLNQCLEPMAPKLGFSQTLVPTIAARLFQGDFHVLSMFPEKMPMLLPYTLERTLAMAVCGLLSYEAPHFIYWPVVVSDIVDLPAMKESLLVQLSDPPLPAEDLTWQFWVYDNGNRVSDDVFRELKLRASRKPEWDLYSFELRWSLPQSITGPLTVFWQTWPTSLNEVGKLQRAQRLAALNGLYQLEAMVQSKRTHWGGQARIWWAELDSHPLMLLLAAGDAHAICLAADLVGVPVPALAYLLGIAATVSVDSVESLLLADLCGQPLARRLCEEGAARIPDDQPRRSKTHEFSQESPDHIPESAGMDSNVLERASNTLPTWAAREHQTMRGAGLDRLLGSPTRGKSDSSAGKKEVRAVEEEDVDEDEDEGEENVHDGDEEDEQEISNHEEEVVCHDGECILEEPGSAFQSQDRMPVSFRAVMEHLAVDAFPDEMLRLRSDDPRSHPLQPWCRKLCGAENFEAVAIDCIGELRPRATHKCPLGTSSVLDSMLERWRPLPDNMHLLLSTLLVQLSMLLEDEQQTSLLMAIDEAASVSLLVCLSKLHQTRRLCGTTKDEATPLQVRRHLLPAMWGLEMHLRRGQAEARRALYADASTNTSFPMKSSGEWRDGGVAGFGLPAWMIMGRAPASGNWRWDEFKWPHDELVEMCCRLTQTARLSLGVSKAVDCVHPTDGAMVLLRALGGSLSNAESADVVERGWSALQPEIPNKSSYASTLTRYSTDDREDIDPQTLELEADEMLLATYFDLKEDLLDDKKIHDIMAFAAVGADPVDGAYSIKNISLRGRITGRAECYAGLASLLSTSFGHRPPAGEDMALVSVRQTSGERCNGRTTAVHGDGSVDVVYEGGGSELRCSLSRIRRCADSSLNCIGETLRKLLPLRHQLESKVSQWTQLLCTDAGLDAQTAEAMVNISHGFVEDERTASGVVCPKAFRALAVRLRLDTADPEAGVRLLASLCSNGWGLESSSVLAARLGINGDVVRSTIAAATGNVEGWVDLHKALFQKTASRDDFKHLFMRAEVIGREAAAMIGQLEDIAEEVATKSQWEERMLNACRRFGQLSGTDRSGHMRKQRRWLEEVLTAIVPLLTGSQLCEGCKDARVGMCPTCQKTYTLISMCAFVVHVLSSQNCAAAELLEKFQVKDLPLHEDADKFSIAAQNRSQGALDGFLGATGSAAVGPGMKSTGGTNILRRTSSSPSSSVACDASRVFLKAFGLTRAQAKYFRYFSMMLSQPGEISAKDIDGAMKCLAKPLTAYVLKSATKTEQTLDRTTSDDRLAAIPTDVPQEWGIDDENLKQETGERMEILLDCIFGMVIRDNKRVLRAMRMIMLRNLKSTLVTHKDLLFDIETKDVRRVFYEPLKAEVCDLIMENSLVRALVLVKTLESFRKISETRTHTRHKTGVAEGLPQMASRLHAWYSSSAVRTIPSAEAFRRISAPNLAAFGVASPVAAFITTSWPASPAMLDLAVSPLVPPPSATKPFLAAGLSVTWPAEGWLSDWAAQPLLPCLESSAEPLIQKAGLELQYLEFGLTAPAGAAAAQFGVDLPAPRTSEPLRMAGLAAAGERARLDAAAQMAATTSKRGLASSQEAFNAMMHFFVAFAACVRASAGNNNTQECAAKLRELFGEFPDLLPILAAVSTGRIELFLTQMHSMVKRLGPTEWADGRGLQNKLGDVDVVLDVLSLLGMNQNLYMSIDPGGHGDAEIAPALMSRIFSVVNNGDDKTKHIGKKLMKLLVGLAVEAPQGLLDKQIILLRDLVMAHIKNEIRGETTLLNAAEDLVRGAQFMYKEKSRGKSLEQMQLFKASSARLEPLAMVMLSATLDLLVPFLAREMRKPLQAVLKVLVELAHLRADPSLANLARRRVPIVEGTAVAFGVPKHTVSGIIALAQGDWAGATEMCRPFCSLDLEVLTHMSRLLPSVRQTIAPETSGSTRREDVEALVELRTRLASRARVISHDVALSKGSLAQLFDMTDVDKSGRIEIEELKVVMTRLGFNLNEHRINEILSKCKTKAFKKAGPITKGDVDGLDEEEFKMALDYLKQRVAADALCLLGNSWERLMMILVWLCFQLLLICIFIFLGISAFTTGGVFSAVVNSGLTIAAGIGLSKKKTGESMQTAKSVEKVQLLVAEVKDTLFGDH